jgi:integrase
MATFQKRGDRWRAQVRKKGYPPLSKTFTTKARAERWARETESKIEGGTFEDRRALDQQTFGELLDRYKKRTPDIGRTKGYCLDLLERGFGAERLSALTKQRIARYGRERAEQGAGPATLAQDLIYLRVVLETARNHWDIPVDPEAVVAARAVLRSEGLIAKSEERDRRPTDDELATLFTYWRSPKVRRVLAIPMEDVVRFAIASCMRLSEITRIRWEDINEADRTIIIRDRKHPLKKKGNHQEVPLLGDAWTIVQRQPRIEDEPRIFPHKQTSIGANFTRAVLRCRIDDLHFHDLRHHGISLLFEDGYQIHEVALVSGHSDWRQLQRYTQLRAKDLHRERKP